MAHPVPARRFDAGVLLAGLIHPGKSPQVSAGFTGADTFDRPGVIALRVSGEYRMLAALHRNPGQSAAKPTQAADRRYLSVTHHPPSGTYSLSNAEPVVADKQPLRVDRGPSSVGPPLRGQLARLRAPELTYMPRSGAAGLLQQCSFASCNIGGPSSGPGSLTAAGFQREDIAGFSFHGIQGAGTGRLESRTSGRRTNARERYQICLLLSAGVR